MKLLIHAASVQEFDYYLALLPDDLDRRDFRVQNEDVMSTDCCRAQLGSSREDKREEQQGEETVRVIQIKRSSRTEADCHPLAQRH